MGARLGDNGGSRRRRVSGNWDRYANEKRLFKNTFNNKILKSKTLPYKTNLFENLHIG